MRRLRREIGGPVTTRMFPVLFGSDRKKYEAIGAPKAVPWELLAAHESQALANHSQSLEILARRGGLGIEEMAPILEGRKAFPLIPLDQAMAIVQRHLAEWRARWVPPFEADGIEDLCCPACGEETCVYVRRQDSYRAGEVCDAYCMDCGATLKVRVEMVPHFGDPVIA